MNMEHKSVDGVVEKLSSQQKTVKKPEAFITSIEIFDANLSDDDRSFLLSAINSNRDFGDIEIVKRVLDGASEEGLRTLEEKVMDFKYCADSAAQKALAKQVVDFINTL